MGDKLKKCLFNSNTCKSKTQLNTGKRCISDCEGRANGDYQSCLGCDVYASCSEGIFTDNRPCPDEGTVWDDKLKKCLFNSNTCKSKRQLVPRSTGKRCISDCEGRANGDYQSCLRCDVYASCSEGIFTDNRPCPDEGTVWDDKLKKCLFN